MEPNGGRGRPPLFKRVGLTPGQLRATVRGDFRGAGRLLVRLVDKLHDSASISELVAADQRDELWSIEKVVPSRSSRTV